MVNTIKFATIRHCERSEAIQKQQRFLWIASHFATLVVAMTNGCDFSEQTINTGEK